jgi:glycosyltransferase involved in cell wall biosynthesis
VSTTNQRSSIAYITLNGRIPSTTANSVGVMTMCGQFSVQGLRTMLLVPGQQGTPLADLSSARDVFEYYSVAARFEFQRLLNPFSTLSRLASPYSLALVLYARAKGYALITTRALEVAVWAARLGIPVILESHNFSKFEKHRMLGSWIAFTQQAEKPVSMIVTTHAGKRSYVRMGVPEDRIRVLPNGVNVERFSVEVDQASLRNELDLPTDVPLLAFSGSLREGRGVEEMLDCAALLPEVQVLIVGGTPADVSRYQELARQRGIGNVHFAGHVAQSVLPKYLLAADILLMPYTTRFSEHSFEYTSPMKMFEYLATGRPIVATDFPILHEVLEHERNAIFVAPDSGAELARGARYLLDHPEIAKRIGQTAKTEAQGYSWQARATAVIEWQRSLGYLD